ncbi:MAG TPA: carbohydrate ABC transporter permease [Anaerolineales bacterium]|nr:carbohydrate ABC transporter permease [Anaerolineales bacterium]
MKLSRVQTEDGITASPIPRPKEKTRVNLWGSQVKNGLNATFVTVLTLAVLVMFLAPFAFMIFTSLKTQEQISIVGAPIWPAKPPVYEYNGKQVEVFIVPLGKCEGFDPGTNGTRHLALVTKGQKESAFVDPDDVGRGEFTCAVSWRALDRAWEFSPTWSNYQEVWNTIDYPRLMWNTTFYAIATTIAVLLSCTLVAFGFSRFRFPGRDFLFIVLISTIFLPAAVTVIPTYTFFQRIGWVGTWLPLIVPVFFANAYDVFLLRQYFMTLPRELDEAAMIDGASPLRILWSVIIPQSYPALMAVTVFHIVFAWNDYFGPLIYLSTNRDAWPISIALSTFNGIYGQRPQLIQAGALMALIAPLLLFVVAQRFFVQGIVITGVEK